ncbi:hypothetical protein D3C79_838050 [compost metagenome]
MATYDQRPRGLAVTRHLVAVIVHGFQVDAEWWPALLDADGETRLFVQAQVRRFQGIHCARR